MKNPKTRKSETSGKKTTVPRPPRKREKKRTGDEIEELFGVHIISDADTKNHLGISEEKPDGDSEN